MRIRALLRLAVLGAVAAVLTATTVTTCVDHDEAAFDATTSCGPAGVLVASYSGATRGCNGACFGYLEAPGANALGLPEHGEADGLVHGTSAPGPGDVLRSTHFALVGPAPLPGAVPPLTVERRCRATHRNDDSGVVDLACEGDVPEAACAGTLTFRPGGP